MGKAHRQFHRRQVVTVNVEVIATLDSAGNVIGLNTQTPADPTPAAAAAPSLVAAAAVNPSIATPAAVAPSVVPAAAAAPSVAAAAVPSVPAVPPFPSDLAVPNDPAVPTFPSDLVVPSVPAYPWPSGVPTAEASDASTQPATIASSARASSSAPTSTVTSTASSTTASSSKSVSTSSSSSRSSSRSSSQTSTRSSITSSSTTSSATTEIVATATGGGGDVTPSAAASPAPSTHDQSSGPLETPKVVGAVIGSLAGFALLLCLLLFLLKRQKKKQRGGALQLTGEDRTDPSQPAAQSSTQPMAQNSARTSYVTPSFLKRFSGVSRSTVSSSGTGEKSFQRISGRKLPSAFSEGMTSEQFAAGREGTLSGSSFYHDDKGFYGGPGVMSKDFGDSSFAKEIGETSHTGAVGTEARVRPSPAQTPVIRHADEHGWGTPPPPQGTFSPPLTPNQDNPRATLGRSLASRDGSTISRNSRFTENV